MLLDDVLHDDVHVDDNNNDNNDNENYPITKNRPMLYSTRKWIYLQFYYECLIWAKEFNIIYPDCLNVIN